VTTLPITFSPRASFVRAFAQRPAPLVLCLAIVLGGSATLGAIIVAAAGMRLEPAGFGRFVVLAATMGGLAFWCRTRDLDRRFGAAAAIVGAATLSLMICGVIANAGLRLGAPLVDPRLAAADAALGFDSGEIIRAVAARPALTQLLAVLYNSSGVAVVALIGWALVRQSVAKAWELATTAIMAMQLVALASPAFPALGAMRHFALESLQGHGLPTGAGVYQWAAFEHFHRGGDNLLRLSDMGGVVAFPSFHTVLALLITQALAGTRWWLPATLWTAGIILAAIPMGGHYVIDLAAGFAVWLAAASIAKGVTDQ